MRTTNLFCGILWDTIFLDEFILQKLIDIRKELVIAIFGV
jgi:hypothetical protein